MIAVTLGDGFFFHGDDSVCEPNFVGIPNAGAPLGVVWQTFRRNGE